MSGDPAPVHQQPSDHGTIAVALLGIPVALHVDAAAHQEALQREIDVISIDESSAAPVRLRSLIDELQERFGGLTEHPGVELQAAIDRGDDAVDLTFDVPVEVGEAAGRLADLFDEVDEYCRQGEHLLTLASPPRVVAYRRWFLGQFVDQVRGEPPTPWNGAVSDAADAEVAESQLEEADAGRPQAVASEGADNRASLPEGWAVHEQGDEVTVRPRGELDLQSAPEVRDVVQAARRGHIARVRLDLSEVTFIDSVGLSMLVSAHQRLDADGVPLVVVVPAMLRRLFDISGLGELLDLRD